MDRTFTFLFALLLLAGQQGFAQKVVELHKFEMPESQSGYLFAGENFYLNQNTFFDVLNLGTGSSSTVSKVPQQQLVPGVNMGALGSAVLFSAAADQNLYIADNAKSSLCLSGAECRQIIPGNTSTFVLYLLAGEGYKLIEIDQQARQPSKFWFAGEEAAVKMAYDATEDLLYFSNKTSPSTVALYVSDGTMESTKLLKSITVSPEETIYESYFLNNGNGIYFVNFTYSNAGPSQYASHVYSLTPDAATEKGTYHTYNFYPRQSYITGSALYGYDSETGSVVKAEGGSYTYLLPSGGLVNFEGEFNANVLFTVPSASTSLFGDSLVTLYETDGTADGTHMISDKVNAFFTDGSSIKIHEQTLYFIKEDDILGAELYKYEEGKVSLVADVVPGQAGLQQVKFYIYKKELYFSAELFKNPKQLHIYKLSGNASTIRLSAYADLNGNQSKDDEEPYLPHQQFSLSEGGYTVFTNQDKTEVNLQDGSYTLSLEPGSGWRATGVASFRVNLPQDHGKHYSIGLAPEQISTKVEASLLSDATRCGFLTPYVVHYRNSGFTQASGSIKLKPEAKFIYASATPEPSRFSGDTLIWDVNALPIGEKGKIVVNFTMPGVEHIGDTLVSALVTKFKALHSESTHANTTRLQQILTCSYDPNDIQATPIGIGSQHLTLKNQPLQYLIRFQNMGTDNALNVVVENELQQEFDLSTLNIVASSHSMYTVQEGNTLRFRFDNIQLPYEKADEAGSHGYVLYSINPKANLPDNTVVQNQASIYFDYNPAVMTNVAVNTLVDALPVETVLAIAAAPERNTPVIYPNPAGSSVYVAWPTNQGIPARYRLLNSKGQLVLQAFDASAVAHALDVSGLPKGLYLLKAERKGVVVTKKILLQ